MDVREENLKVKLEQTKENLGQNFSAVLDFENNVSDRNSQLEDLIKAVSAKEAELSAWMSKLELQRETYENEKDDFEQKYQKQRLTLDQEIARYQDLLESLEFQSSHLFTKRDEIVSVANGTFDHFDNFQELETNVNEHEGELFGMTLTGEMVQTSKEIERLLHDIAELKNKIYNLDKSICKSRLRMSDFQMSKLAQAQQNAPPKTNAMKERMIEVMKETADIRSEITKLSNLLLQKQREKAEITKEIEFLKADRQGPIRTLTKVDRMIERVSKAHEHAERMTERIERLSSLRQTLAEKLNAEEKCTEMINRLDAKITARLECIEVEEKNGIGKHAPFLKVLLDLELQIKRARDEEARLGEENAPEQIEACMFPSYFPTERKLNRLGERLARALSRNQILVKKCHQMAVNNRALKAQIDHIGRQIRANLEAQQVCEITHNDNIARMYEYKMTVPDILENEQASVAAAIVDVKNRIRERKRRLRERMDNMERVVMEYGAFSRTGGAILQIPMPPFCVKCREISCH